MRQPTSPPTNLLLRICLCLSNFSTVATRLGELVALQNIPDNDGDGSGHWERLGDFAHRSLKWIIGCILAGLAVAITSTSTQIGNSAVRSIETGYCKLRIDRTPDSSRFRVVVARLENDKDDVVQERVAAQLVPTSFSALRGCSFGPATFDEKGKDFDDRARDEATRQLAALSADVMIFGRVDGDKVGLRFADRNGYCSNVIKTLSTSNLDQETARSAFARALADRIVKALVSDCKAKKLKTLSRAQLQEFADKIGFLVSRYGTTGEPDIKMNLWTYRAWVLARLAEYEQGGRGAQQIVGDVLAGTPDQFAKAASLWGLSLFADRTNNPRLSHAVLDEAYIATRNWQTLSPAWISMAMLARDRVEADHDGDAVWRLRHYDEITDRVDGQGADFVPMFESDYYRALYRYAIAVTEAPGATDQQIESAMSVLSDLLKQKLAGDPVPVTTNGIRYELARALVQSAARQSAPSRLTRAMELVRFITAHPDDSVDITPKLINDLRAKLAGECRRQRCQPA